MYTIGAPEIYDPLLLDDDLVKMGRRADYVGGSVFPDVASARAAIAPLARLYHIYLLDGDYNRDSYQVEGREGRHLSVDAKVLSKVCPVEEL